MPCQWTAAGSWDWLTIVIATGLPLSSTSVGPGSRKRVRVPLLRRAAQHVGVARVLAVHAGPGADQQAEPAGFARAPPTEEPRTAAPGCRPPAPPSCARASWPRAAAPLREGSVDDFDRRHVARACGSGRSSSRSGSATRRSSRCGPAPRARSRRAGGAPAGRACRARRRPWRPPGSGSRAGASGDRDPVRLIHRHSSSRPGSPPLPPCMARRARSR